MKHAFATTALSIAIAAGVALAGCKKNDAASDTTAATPAGETAAGSADTGTVTAPAPAPAAGMTVTTIDLGTAVGTDNRVTTPASAFAAGDTIHVSVATDGAGGDLTARWTYQDGQVVDSQDKTVPAGAQVTDFSISKPDGWPAGHYRLEVLNGGMVVQTREFDIK